MLCVRPSYYYAVRADTNWTWCSGSNSYNKINEDSAENGAGDSSSQRGRLQKGVPELVLFQVRASSGNSLPIQKVSAF